MSLKSVTLTRKGWERGNNPYFTFFQTEKELVKGNWRGISETTCVYRVLVFEQPKLSTLRCVVSYSFLKIFGAFVLEIKKAKGWLDYELYIYKRFCRVDADPPYSLQRTNERNRLTCQHKRSGLAVRKDFHSVECILSVELCAVL